MRPYARAVGVPVAAEPALTIGPADDRAAAAQRAAELATAGEPVILCGHRENLPAMIDAARAALHARSPSEPPLPKGCFVVLQSADGVLFSAERHDLSN